MVLQKLFESVPGILFFGNQDLEVTGLEYDSRRVRAGQVFFAIRGTKQDGARFIPEAVSRGAAAVVAETPPQTASGAQPLGWVQAPDVRLAMALGARAFYGDPSGAIRLIGVTGTNGKTTVAFLLASILKTAGWRPGLFGTIEYDIEFDCGESGGGMPAPNTTPESVELQRMLRQVAERGGRAAVMEVSSHALALDRVTGCSFHAAVFTNFSRDHLDFHQDMESYFAAKQKLFVASQFAPAPSFAVLNADDPRCASLRDRAGGRIITYGLKVPADVATRRWKASRQGLEFTAETPAGAVEICSPLIGRHNIHNLLAAVAAALTLEIAPPQISEGVAGVRVPGRMQSIDEGQPFTVLVDYAHTEEALRNLLQSARECCGDGRIILVFGCGGERDRSKRPAMGLAAAQADKVVLTSDNPRGEDPLSIINDAVVGLQKGKAHYQVEPDRARAIGLAIGEARAGDTVLIAGKGHEKYQLIGSQKLAFDDCAVARAALRRRGLEKQELGVRS